VGTFNDNRELPSGTHLIFGFLLINKLTSDAEGRDTAQKDLNLRKKVRTEFNLRRKGNEKAHNSPTQLPPTYHNEEN